MRLILVALLVLVSLVPAFNAHAQTLSELDRSRGVGPPLHVRLTLNEFPRRTVSGTVLVADSGTVLLADRRDTLYVALRTVRKVEMRGHQTYRGFEHGLLFGLATTGVLYGAGTLMDRANGPPCDFCFTARQSALIGGVVLTGLFTLISSTIRTYEWNEIDRAELQTRSQAP